MPNFKFMSYLVAFYMTLKLAVFTLGDKTVILFGAHVAAGTLVIPLWFFVGDIITEVYGYKIAKKIIWIALICQFIFAGICFLFAHLPSNSSDINNLYDTIFDRMPRLAFSSLLAILLGAVINSYYLDKWKIALKGKFFILRSLTSTMLGEFIFTFIAIYSQFWGKQPNIYIFQILVASLVVKLMVNLIVAWPVSFAARAIKFYEGEDIEIAPNHSFKSKAIL